MTLSWQASAAPTTAPTSERNPLDAAGVLVVYVVLLVGVPSELIVQPLGAAGTPAQIFGIGLLLWWLLSRLLPRRPIDEAVGPVKWILLAFVLSTLLSYAVGSGLPRSAVEHRSADRASLTLAAWAGVALVASDGLSSRNRLDRLLKVLGAGVTGVALLGMVQFFFGFDIARIFAIPGLSANDDFGSLVTRSLFRRVSGTTLHPIEFGVVLSSVLPLLVHFAIHNTPGRRLRWWVAAAIVGAALPMSVARTAIIGGALAGAVAFFGWPRMVRRRMLLLAPFGFVGMQVAIPGLLGTIKSLFLNAQDDPSTQGRTDDYGPVLRYFADAPLTGRGVGTFIPSLYRTLDNQYLGTLMESGALGLAALFAVLAGGVLIVVRVRRRLVDSVDRSLAQSLAAGLAVPLVCFVTFDGLAFPMCAGITFLLFGVVGALWRLERADRLALVQRPLRAPRVWLPRLAAISALAAVVVCSYGAWVVSQRVDYQATTVFLVDAPGESGVNPYLRIGRGVRAANVLHSALVGPEVQQQVKKRFPDGDFGVAIGEGSFERDSDANLSASSLRERTTAPSPEVAGRMREALLDITRAELLRLQQQAGVPREVQLVVRPLETAGIVRVSGSRMRVAVALMAVLALVVGTAGATLRRQPRALRGVERADPAAPEADASSVRQQVAIGR